MDSTLYPAHCAICLGPCGAPDNWERDKHRVLTLQLAREGASRGAGFRAAHALTPDERRTVVRPAGPVDMREGDISLPDGYVSRALVGRRGELESAEHNRALALRECAHCGKSHSATWAAYLCERNAVRKALRRQQDRSAVATPGWRVYRSKAGYDVPIAPRKAAESGIWASGAAVTLPDPCGCADGCGFWGCGRPCDVRRCLCDCHEGGPLCGACQAGLPGVVHRKVGTQVSTVRDWIPDSGRTAASLAAREPDAITLRDGASERPRRARGGKGKTRAQRGLT